MPEESLPQEVNLKCASCDSNLPTGASYCPTCGTITPYNIAVSKVSPYDYTAASSSNAVPQSHPSTDYGSPAYGVPRKNPYEPLNPYEAPLRPPPPPLPQRQVKIGLLIGTVVLALVLVSGGVFAFLRRPLPAPTTVAAAAQPSVTATTTNASQSLYINATSSNPVLTDPMSGQDANNWDVNSTKDSGCIFEGGAYHIVSFQTGYYTPCLAEVTNFSNLAFQAEMTVIKGSGGGLLVRCGGAVPYGYRFFIGRDYFDVNENDKQLTLSTAVTAKLNQTYLLTVIARGSSMSLYVDKQWIATVEGSSASSGALGLMAFQGEVVFKTVRAKDAWERRQPSDPQVKQDRLGVCDESESA